MANARSDAVELTYPLRTAARLTGLSPELLRAWERRHGVVEPFRTPGGTRRYSDEDLARLGLIQELTSAGVNLEGVRRILELQSDNDRLRSQVDRLRRLLGEAEARYGGTTLPSTPVGPQGVRRNLPDIIRWFPFRD